MQLAVKSRSGVRVSGRTRAPASRLFRNVWAPVTLTSPTTQTIGDRPGHSGTHAFDQVPVQPRRGAGSCSFGYSAPRTCPFGGACHTCPAVVQAKLVVGEPDDEYEKEADRIADEVMRMPDPSVQRVCPSCDDKEQVQTKPLTADRITHLVQRQVDPEEDEEKVLQTKPEGKVQRQAEPEDEEEEVIQTKHATAAATSASAKTEASIAGLRGGGRPLTASERTFFEPRFGRNFSKVRIHDDARAARSAFSVRGRAFTRGSDIDFASGQSATATRTGRHLLAHELTHVVQQSPQAAPEQHSISLQVDPTSRIRRQETPQLLDAAPQPSPVCVRRFVSEAEADGAIQRDLALELPPDVVDQPDLSEAQVQAAIRYNRASYDEESTRLIQDVVGAEQTGEFDETTVRLIARFQEDFGLEVDGKAGPTTHALLIRELTAEAVAPTTCLTLFQVVGPRQLRFFRLSPTTGTIQSLFRIRIRFDPRCNCRDWQYRQYIAGSVDLHDVAGPTLNMNSRFTHLPAGMLTGTLQEDGDTSIPPNVAGHHYGHRSYADNPSNGRDRYLPSRLTGCRYEARDIPELSPVPAAAGDSGDRYVWNVRFRGAILRRGHGVVEDKYWVVRGSVQIP